jgi:hypothetical protein
MPQSQTIWRAKRVACLMSLEAPLEISPEITFSPMRPAIAMQM